MNYNVNHFFVVKTGTSLLTAGTTSSLVEGQLGVFDKNYNALNAAPSVLASPFLIIAQGSGDSKIGSFKSSHIYLSNVRKWYGVSSDLTSKEQVTYIGFDEINDCKSPTLKCDEEYTVTVRVDEHYLNAVWRPRLEKSFLIKTACCDDCEGGCDNLDPKVYLDKLVADINDYFKNEYVVASTVSKLVSGSPSTQKFALVLPDPGTNLGGVQEISYATAAAGVTDGSYVGVASSGGTGAGATFDVTVLGGVVTDVVLNAAGAGYAIGDTLTIAGTAMTGGTTPADDITVTVTSTTGEEGDLITEIRSLYGSFVTDPQTDIVFSADAEDSSGDANATGNVMIELTPSTTITADDLEYYNGVAWTELPCAPASDAVYVAGVKLTASTPAGLENDCKPDKTPYIANKVIFDVFVEKGPISTQDRDMPDFCNLWDITTTQIPGYPVGEAQAIAEMERHYTKQKYPFERRYWDPTYNQDEIVKLFADSSKTYDMYVLDYVDPSANSAFEVGHPNGHRVTILVPDDAAAWKTSFESIMNTYLANSPSYQGAVTL